MPESLAADPSADEPEDHAVANRMHTCARDDERAPGVVVETRASQDSQLVELTVEE
jgi:hypothetical protein